MQPSVEQQFEEFYRRHERRVRQFVFGMCGDASLASDAVQETWMRYLRYAQQPEPRFDLALLIAVARNVVRTFWRRRRWEFLHPDLESHQGGPAFEDSILLSDLVSRLPYSEREVVVLHYGLDLPIDAICSQLGETPGAIKSRLHRARMRLRHEFLAKEGDNSGNV